MGCQEILIGGKEKEEERHYACFEGKKKTGRKGKQKGSYMLKPSWLRCSTLDFRSRYY